MNRTKRLILTLTLVLATFAVVSIGRLFLWFAIIGQKERTVAPKRQAVPRTTLDDQFLQAFNNGDMDKAQSFLEQGANVDAENIGGMTPLFNAVLGLKVDQVKWLLSKGADPNHPNIWGISPWSKASEPGRADLPNTAEIVRLLKQYGAK